MSYLTKEEIESFKPAGAIPSDVKDLAKPLREGLEAEGYFTPEQMAGRNFPMACVALEITQRCNLDCTLCYLSDLAEAVQDVPMYELKRRIQQVFMHYGAYTNIQITGGDPTLRSIPDLVEIVEEIKSYPMRCALFTNGIKASREMLEALSEAGLDDVVYHVDMTQERKGYASETDLNTVRLDYIKRAEGLPLRVLFNTTVFDENVKEIPELVSFFVSNAEKINLVSFQMQADTGRGVLRERDEDLITQQRMMQLLEKGAGVELSFDAPLIGHPECNKYSAILKAGNKVTALYDDKKFFQNLFPAISSKGENWSVEENVLPAVLSACAKSPKLLFLAARYSLKKAWQFRMPLLKGKKPHRLSFFIHNFMDAEKLQRGRCESCVFMVATAEGPLSMCVHNAKRDKMISLEVPDDDKQKGWKPLGENGEIDAKELPLKRLKGRLREEKKDKKKKNETFLESPTN